jgi:hypothetical protein
MRARGGSDSFKGRLGDQARKNLSEPRIPQPIVAPIGIQMITTPASIQAWRLHLPWKDVVASHYMTG